MKTVLKQLSIFLVFGIIINAYAELPEVPRGIRIKYATADQLAVTELEKGEILINEDDVSDVRMGDGETLGGEKIGAVLDHLDINGSVSINTGKTNFFLQVALVRTNNLINGTNYFYATLSDNNSRISILLKQLLDDYKNVYLCDYPGHYVINTNYFITEYGKRFNSDILYFNLSDKSTNLFKPNLNSYTATFSLTNEVDIRGKNSVVHGNPSIAYGNYSHAEGLNTIALGDYSHSEGYFTKAPAFYSHAEGSTAEANGTSSHAEGSNTKANGTSSHAEGSYSKTYGYGSHAEGDYSMTFGNSSHAEGSYSKTYGYRSHAEGEYMNIPSSNVIISCTITNDNDNFSIVKTSIPIRYFSLGDKIYFSWSSGIWTNVTVTDIDYDNNKIDITKLNNTSPGRQYVLNSAYLCQNIGTGGTASHSEGNNTFANGDYSHAEGIRSVANEMASFVWSGYPIITHTFVITNGKQIVFADYGYPCPSTLTQLIPANGGFNGKEIIVSFTNDGLPYYYIDGWSTVGNSDKWISRNDDTDWSNVRLQEEYLKYPITFNIYNASTGEETTNSITITPKLYPEKYYSHGEGTFNINPIDGLDGFYIGETNLTDHIKNISSNNLPAATAETLGGIKVGNNLNVTEDGVLSVPNADANTSTKGVTYLITDSFGTTSENGRVGYATTEYTARQFIKKSVFPYPIFQTSNTYKVGDRIQYKFNIYECLEDNVSGTWSVVSNKFKVIDPIQTQIDEIDSNVSSISNTVDTISDKVDSFDSEEWTFTLDNGSQVEKHIGVSSNSWPETCYLFWNTNYVAEHISSSFTIYIPTNFPTKRLYLVVDDTDQAKLYIATKNSISDFDRNVIIDIVPVRTTTSETMTTRDFRVNVAASQVGSCNANNSWRAFHIEYDAITKTWFGEARTLASRQYYFTNGEKTYCPSENVPATVEEWIALQNPQTETTPTQPLFGGTFTLPVSPTPDEPTSNEQSDEDDSEIDDEEEEPDEESEEDITEGE